MGGIDIAGLALASVDALLKTYSALEQHRDARREVPKLLNESKKRVKRMRASVDRYSHGIPQSAIPGTVLENARVEFIDINSELKSLLATERITFKLRQHVDKVRESNDKLRALEHHLDVCGLVIHVTRPLHEQLQQLADVTRKTMGSHDDSEITSVLQTIDKALTTSEVSDADVGGVPEQARDLLNALTNSGLPDEKKHELSKMALKVWNGWKIDPLDIEFVRNKKRNRKRLGKGAAGQVYLARMKVRDERGEIIAGEFMEVAVKQFTVKPGEEKEKLSQFIREVFIQKDAKHPCIVHTFGGYWPEPEELEEGDQISPYIVMERMSLNLRQALANKLLETLDAKRRILLDILEGITHLHGRRIVHRDIKPENVLLRVVDGKIVGPAKVCDFSVSRKARETDMMTTTMRTSTRLAGTLAYMPPETFTDSARKGNVTSRDVWSFGVLMCEVLEPHFLANLVRDHSEELHRVAGRIEFAEKVAESAEKISCDWLLDHIVMSCLFLDPALRPRVEDLCTRMENDAPVYQFRFENCYSWDYRANEVCRFVRKRLAVEAKGSNIEPAVAVLREAAREKSDLSALSALGYCHYYGIGVEKDEKKAFQLFQKGCDAEDEVAMFAMGVVHFRAGRNDAAVTLFTKAVELGSAGGMAWLSYCYRKGYGVEKDEKRSFQLVSSAAEGGDEEAEVNLADYYIFGIGTSQDERKAVNMLHRLSASGNAYASMSLALWYQEGYGVRKDEEKAKQLHILARKRGIIGEWVFNRKRNHWKFL